MSHDASVPAVPGTSRRHAAVTLFATLFLFWWLLNSHFAWDHLLAGVAVSLLITLLLRDSLSFFTEMRFTQDALLASFRWMGVFLRELFRSNLRLAAIVVSPRLPIHPGIVQVRTRLRSRMGRLMLANAITLTPGTLTVELEGEWLYVHWVNVEAEDVDAATARIVADFERHLEVMYG